ncbi:MAG: hypothetical protein GFH27_549307n4 [Chloroflexi bacterium AL-W]|nr:hypothetical protein [Chloroflexi bacterium AL-N1]NOK69036.1 hypothetical protein [Chloroflexi bacterium AL-N10]NOK77019.1 hypothetical protein [Chloroflexi bacterium AL-N5]NOK83664.1 hypothetical protein [Chloroflexi bacterium AL-W]NOK90874.1 hypothetical protein [Chloroflexi bacterium AL-N15]
MPTPTPKADLAITKTVNQPHPFAGDSITYTIQVQNKGPASASGVIVTEQIPAGLVKGVDPVPHPSQGTYSNGTWTIGSLASGASTTLTLSFGVKEDQVGKTIQNTVTVSSASPVDPVSSNNTASVSLTPKLLDTDSDKVSDFDDHCPDQSGLSSNKGCPSEDTDGDGVKDHEDACRTDRGPKDNAGCPKQESPYCTIDPSHPSCKPPCLPDEPCASRPTCTGSSRTMFSANGTVSYGVPVQTGPPWNRRTEQNLVYTANLYARSICFEKRSGVWYPIGLVQSGPDAYIYPSIDRIPRDAIGAYFGVVVGPQGSFEQTNSPALQTYLTGSNVEVRREGVQLQLKHDWNFKALAEGQAYVRWQLGQQVHNRTAGRVGGAVEFTYKPNHERTMAPQNLGIVVAQNACIYLPGAGPGAVNKVQGRCPLEGR